MTLREFIKTFNFKMYYNNKEDTRHIRIYDCDEPDLTYFEFGVRDWGYETTRDKFVEQVISKKILNKSVVSIGYNDDAELVEVTIGGEE